MRGYFNLINSMQKTSYTVEAKNYFDQVGASVTITGAQKTLIENFIKGLKTNNWWTNTVSIHFFPWANSTANKWNMKNPVDTDAGKRLSYAGVITHDATGMHGNGTSGIANTFVQPSTDFSSTSDGVYVYYHGSNLENATITPMIAWSSAQIFGDWISSTTIYPSINDNNNFGSTTIPRTKGLRIVSRNPVSTGNILYRKNSTNFTVSQSITSRPTGTVYLMGQNAIGNYTTIPLIFAMTYNGKMTTTEQATLEGLIQTLVTGFGLNTY